MMFSVARSFWMVVVGAAVFSASHFAHACSTCLCGDPTLTTLGLEKPYEGRARVSLSSLYRVEEIGRKGFNEREITEQRYTLGLSYWPSKTLAVGARLPWTEKTLETANLSEEESSAMGDLELDVRWYGYKNKPNRPSHIAGLQFGLRMPTAEEQKQNREALDFDVQPGAGLWIPNLGAWYGYFSFPWFVNVSMVANIGVGEGHSDYQFGNALNTTFMAQYALNPTVAFQLGFDTRWSGRDEFAGETDKDSGGFIGYISPGIVLSVAEDMQINLNAQLVAIDQLNGDHAEDRLFHVGISYDIQ